MNAVRSIHPSRLTGSSIKTLVLVGLVMSVTACAQELRSEQGTHLLERLFSAPASEQRVAATHALRCTTYVRQGLPQDAVRECHTAINTDPNNVPALSSRGEAHYLLGNYDAAIADLKRAIALDPDFIRPYRFLQYTYRDSRRIDEWVRDFDTYRQAAPHDEWLRVLSIRAHLFAGNFQEAGQILDQGRTAYVYYYSHYGPLWSKDYEAAIQLVQGGIGAYGDGTLDLSARALPDRVAWIRDRKRLENVLLSYLIEIQTENDHRNWVGPPHRLYLAQHPQFPSNPLSPPK